MSSLIGGSIDPTKGHVLNLITQGSDILKDKLHIHEGLAKSLIKVMTTTFFSSNFDTSCKLHSIASASAPPGQQQECFFFPTTTIPLLSLQHSFLQQYHSSWVGP